MREYISLKKLLFVGLTIMGIGWSNPLYAAALLKTPAVNNMQSRSALSESERMDRVPVTELNPVDLSAIPLSAFSDEDLETGRANPYPMPYYLAHFHTLANSVEMDGERLGWINQWVWRTSWEFEDGNPRCMETVLDLAWFYSVQHSWNPYYGDPLLRQRLEEALRCYIGFLDGKGMIKQVADEHIGFQIAATMFFTKFIGGTLALLENAPEIDPELHQKIFEEDRRVLLHLLRSDLAVVQGRQFSNQYGALICGTYAYLSLKDDPEVRSLAEHVFPQIIKQLQSPAGFPYENHSADWGYSLGTHHSNTTMAFYYAEKAGIKVPWLTEETERWAEWIAYNSVPEPGYLFFTLNRGIEGRQSKAGFTQLEAPFASQIPLLRAFLPNREELVVNREKQRREVEKTYPEVEPLKNGMFAFGPYAFLHRGQFNWYPSPEQQHEARQSLPYIAHSQFIHQRVDNRRPLEVTCIRRPGYYAVFNAGEPQDPAQTFGLGLLWNPEAGAVLQSQTRMDDAAWGLQIGTNRVAESALLNVQYRVDGEQIHPQSGNQNLPDGELEIYYRVEGLGEKILRFEQDRIFVIVNPGSAAFTEQIPLLVPVGAAPEIQGETLRIPYGRGVYLIVRTEGAVKISWTSTDRMIGAKKVMVLNLEGARRLVYSLRFEISQE